MLKSFYKPGKTGKVYPMIEYPKHPDIPTSHLPFSPVVKVGDTLYVSGQASVDKGGNIIAGSFESEFRRSMENLKNILENSGSDLKHIVKTTNYLQRAEDLPTFNRLYKEYFEAPYPARTTIAPCLPQTILFEIDCIALIKEN